MNPKRLTSRYIIVKTPKVKAKLTILKATREKQLVTYKGAPIRLSADFQQNLCRPKETGTKYSK